MNHKTLALTLGSAIAASITLAPAVHAAENPFALQALSPSSLVAEAGGKMKDGKCGEGKCGAKKTKTAKAKAKVKEGKCGAGKMKMKEGGCSGNRKMEETAPSTP